MRPARFGSNVSDFYLKHSGVLSDLKIAFALKLKVSIQLSQ